MAGYRKTAPVKAVPVGSIKNERLKMRKFRDLIANMPLNEQAFTSKKRTWEKYVTEFPFLNDLIDCVFGQRSNVEISRQDLFELSEKQKIKEFIFSTIIWGYPAGMRGFHFSSIMRNISAIEKVLTICFDNKNICNWESHHRTVSSIEGLGLSTYTKFLYFLKMRIENYPALILDLRLIDVFKKGVFSEFRELKRIRYDNAPDLYPKYLQLMETTATKYDLTYDNLEMFLFEFGGNLKIRN